MTEIDIFGIPPHPAAEVFQMLDEEELEEMAADIKANGLIMPLLVGQLDGEHVLVDGRNRREACRRAGIVPNYTLLSDGEDLSARVLSENVYRRHLTKGQRAIVIAKLFATNNLTQQAASKQTDVKRARIAKAAVVLKHAPDLANSILTGSISLDNAYEEARIRKGRADTHESRFNALKAVAPDLAEMVVEERLKLEEAEAAERERSEQARQRKKIMAHALHDLARHSYLFLPNWQPRVIDFITHDHELYLQQNAGSVEEFIEALETFSSQSTTLLSAILESTNAQESRNRQSD